MHGSGPGALQLGWLSGSGVPVTGEATHDPSGTATSPTGRRPRQPHPPPASKGAEPILTLSISRSSMPLRSSSPSPEASSRGKQASGQQVQHHGLSGLCVLLATSGAGTTLAGAGDEQKTPRYTEEAGCSTGLQSTPTSPVSCPGQLPDWERAVGQFSAQQPRRGGLREPSDLSQDVPQTYQPPLLAPALRVPLAL